MSHVFIKTRKPAAGGTGAEILRLGLYGLDRWSFLGGARSCQQARPLRIQVRRDSGRGACHAGDREAYTAAFNRCQKEALARPSIIACINDEVVRQDTALNAAWRSASVRVGPRMRGRLEAAQRRWPSERDRFCKSHAQSYRGGTLQPVIYLSCGLEQRIRRTIWLSALR